MTATIFAIAVENGKNVVHVNINGKHIVIDTNIIGFARLAQAGIPVQSVQPERGRI